MIFDRAIEMGHLCGQSGVTHAGVVSVHGRSRCVAWSGVQGGLAGRQLLRPNPEGGVGIPRPRGWQVLRVLSGLRD